MNIVWYMTVRNVLAEEDIGVFMKIEKHYGEGIMTERFTVKEWVLARLLKNRIVLFDDGKSIYRINDIYFDDGVVMCKYDKRWEYD